MFQANNQWQRLEGGGSSNGQPDDDFGIEMRENVRLSAHNTTIETTSRNKYSFFIFTNPISGGYKASALTKLDVRILEIIAPILILYHRLRK